MKCILYPEQYKIIYNVSFLSLGTSMYALYNGHYYLSMCPGGVFLTSINYWIYPDYSWRRYLDMTYVKLALIYQLYKSYGSQYMVHYYLLMVLAFSMYPLGIYYYKKNFIGILHMHIAHCT